MREIEKEREREREKREVYPSLMPDTYEGRDRVKEHQVDKLHSILYSFLIFFDDFIGLESIWEHINLRFVFLSLDLYSLLVFNAICFCFDRFRQAYDRMHAPW